MRIDTAGGLVGALNRQDAADIALGYARDRRRGGPGEAPLPIVAHVDVQRQLLQPATP